MTVPDVTDLQATIAELKEELTTSRIRAEVFRALYTRQVAEIAELREWLGLMGDPTPAPRLHLVPED